MRHNSFKLNFYSIVMDLIIPGNSKMGKEVYMFNLPAKETCTPTDWCLHGYNGKPACYALRGRCIWSNVIMGAKNRYALSKRDDFADLMTQAINKKQVKFMRIHASGDFYSSDYVKKIIEVASACPKTLFRTTTRRRDLSSELQELNSLSNFIVRESLDDERYSTAMNLPFAALSHLDIAKQNEIYLCKEDCTECKHHCWKNRCNVAFDEL